MLKVFEEYAQAVVARSTTYCNYLRACMATMVMCGLSSIQSNGEEMVPDWATLFQCWDAHYTNESLEHLLYGVLHKIHWGVLPDWGICPEWGYEQYEYDLIDCICDEIYCSGFSEFKCRYADVIEQLATDLFDEEEACNYANARCWGTPVQADYLEARTRCLLNVGDKDELEACLRFKSSHEEAVKLLIPEASHWHQLQWTDDDVKTALWSKYGIAYDDDDGIDDYYSLMAVVRGRNESDDESFLWHALVVKALPESLARVIWPENTEETLGQVFLKIVEKIDSYENTPKMSAFNPNEPSGHFRRSYLKTCWLSGLTEKWITDGTLTDDAIKTACFNLCMVD